MLIGAVWLTLRLSTAVWLLLWCHSSCCGECTAWPNTSEGTSCDVCAVLILLSGFPAVLCCVAVLQATHSNLLEQVQQLEVLRKENGEMAQLVAQLQVLKNDQQHLQELCSQVERVRSDNASLQRKSQALPSLQAENERLKVGLCCCVEVKRWLLGVKRCGERT
jgi:hypothetical protein